MASSTSSVTGAQLIARSLHELGVKVVFGLVGIPVIEIAEAAIDLGIRFVGFRNEQAAGYAATAYGYLTGKPGVCLVVGGPGVLHAMAGIGNSAANAFPLLLLAGSAESRLISRGAFQELDAIALLSPHVKLAVRPHALESVSDCVRKAYRISFYGRPGPAFVDLPADLIQGSCDASVFSVDEALCKAAPRSSPSLTASEAQLAEISEVLKNARAPLVVVGKGAAYARAESSILALIESTRMPFLPTPMGKGILPDSHPLNAASSRSAALRQADAVLLLGARLNWILHFGDSPKWNPKAKFIQVDISAEEIGRNSDSVAVGVVADLRVFVPQLVQCLSTWHYDASSSDYTAQLAASKKKNEAIASQKAQNSTSPMNLIRALNVIKDTLHALSLPERGNIVYVSEGANTMDQSRSIFPVFSPRHRLDAGTHATMGIGLGYAIAAWMAYNGPAAEGRGAPSASTSTQSSEKKKIVCLEGDSAFGFSLAEIETMARERMDILVFVLNNGGIYHGSVDDLESFRKLQLETLSAPHESEDGQDKKAKGLRSTTLGFGVRYDMTAQMCQHLGARGWDVSTEEALQTAVEEAWRWDGGGPCVVNVNIASGKGSKLSFAWQTSNNTAVQQSSSKL